MGNECFVSHKEDLNSNVGIRKITSKNEENTKVSMYFQNIDSSYKSLLRQQIPQPDSEISQNDLDFLNKMDTWYYLDDTYTDQSQLLFDKIKFIKVYSNYEVLQSYYAQNWEDIIVEKPIGTEMSKNPVSKISFDLTGKRPVLKAWRYVIRRGLPLSLVRDLIFNIVDLHFLKIKQYENIKENIFQERSLTSIQIVPTFSDDNLSVVENIKVNILNEQGIDALKRILWCLNDTVQNLQYNPAIINTIANLLLFLSESETYFAIKQLLDNSVQQLTSDNKAVMRHLRWHFTLNQDQFYIKSKSFVEFASNRYPKFRTLMQHFSEIQYQGFKKLYQDLTKNFFADIFSYPTVLRLFVIFLNEGIRVYDKIMFGICMILYDQLMQEKDPSKINDIIMTSNLDYDLDAAELIFKQAYTFKIGSIQKSFSKTRISKGAIQYQHNNIIYRPRLKQKSEILEYKEFETIWEWLPPMHKMTDPVRFFCTSQDGYSLGHMYQKCLNYQDSQLLILIKADDYVFGAFLDTMLNIDNKQQFYGGQDCFVFQLKPNICFYPTDILGENDNQSQDYQILTKNEYIQLGVKNPALVIENNLQGFTKCSETYKSLPLNYDGESDLEQHNYNFLAQTIELYALSI